MLIQTNPSKCHTCDLYLDCVRSNDLYQSCGVSVRGGDLSQVNFNRATFNVTPAINGCEYCHFNMEPYNGRKCPMEAIIICDDGDKIFRSILDHFNNHEL